jgi:phosphoglycerol transferase MdoB-like AlkP superfamily enzyme
LVILVWGAFVLMQCAQRGLLVYATLDREVPSRDTLFATLLIGLRGDFMTATYVLVLAAGLASLYSGARLLWPRRRSKTGWSIEWLRGFRGAAAACGGLLLVVLLLDFGYYHFNQQHLNFVFFEYLGDLTATQEPTPDAKAVSEGQSQSVQQTGAELHQIGKWGGRVLAFFLVETMVCVGWWWVVTRWMRPRLAVVDLRHPRVVLAALILCLLGGAVGFHPKGPYAIRIAPISSTAYYTLAQNPVLYAVEGLRAALDSQVRGTPPPGLSLLAVDEAIRRAQALLAKEGTFPSSHYPFVQTLQQPSLRELRPSPAPNVLLIFIEGLDRRFLGIQRRGVAVTPFLDRLKEDSLYFDRFFSNGVQTSRGLLATLCSTYPRHGAAAMKARYTHDYFCMPELLRRAGYRTEMVVSQHRDINRLHLFMSRNGLQQLFDESDFPAGAARLGLGYTDGALFDLFKKRIVALQAIQQPFFLTTLTLATHHPFAFPVDDEAITALNQEQDGYVPALRYTDREFERLFEALRHEGLLRNTIVFILGDHGRHEAVGETMMEKQLGHFMAPLLIWCDESLRMETLCRPGTVHAVTSQVDVAPTILGFLGLSPRVEAFMGRDVSCEVAGPCTRPGQAFLSSVYDDLIGWVDEQGILTYSFRTEQLFTTDIDVQQAPILHASDESTVQERLTNMLALHVASNVLLDQNRLWNWREWGAKL